MQTSAVVGVGVHLESIDSPVLREPPLVGVAVKSVRSGPTTLPLLAIGVAVRELGLVLVATGRPMSGRRIEAEFVEMDTILAAVARFFVELSARVDTIRPSAPTK